MKIRKGFVSNSSSSSFMVQIKDDEDNDLLSREQLELLYDLGFTYTGSYSASGIELGDRGPSDDPTGKLFCSVICNEDDIVEPLLEYRIPFQACCHYGHQTLLYDGGDTYLDMPNLGLEAEMYLGTDYRGKGGLYIGRDLTEYERKVDEDQ